MGLDLVAPVRIGGVRTQRPLGEAIGPLVAGLIWDAAGVGVFFAVRAVLGLSTELVCGRALRRNPAVGRAEVETVRDSLQRLWPGAAHEELVRVWHDHELHLRIGRLSEQLDAPLDAVPQDQWDALERAAKADGGPPLSTSAPSDRSPPEPAHLRPRGSPATG